MREREREGGRGGGGGGEKERETARQPETQRKQNDGINRILSHTSDLFLLSSHESNTMIATPNQLINI